MSRLDEIYCNDGIICLWINGMFEMYSFKSPPNVIVKLYNSSVDKIPGGNVRFESKEEKSKLGNQLNERGEKLNKIEEKSERLAMKSKAFNDGIIDYNAKQADKKWYTL